MMFIAPSEAEIQKCPYMVKGHGPVKIPQSARPCLMLRVYQRVVLTHKILKLSKFLGFEHILAMQFFRFFQQKNCKKIRSQKFFNFFSKTISLCVLTNFKSI